MAANTWNRWEQLLYLVVVVGLILFPRRGEHHIALHSVGAVVLAAAAVAYRQRIAPSILGVACAVLLVDIAYGWWFAKVRVPVEPVWVAVAAVYAIVIAIVVLDDRRRRRIVHA